MASDRRATTAARAAAPETFCTISPKSPRRRSSLHVSAAGAPVDYVLFVDGTRALSVESARVTFDPASLAAIRSAHAAIGTFLKGLR